MDENQNRLRAILAENVRMFRARMGVTKKAMARATGMSEPTLMRIERGIRDTTCGQLIAMATYFGVEPSTLIEREGYKK